MNYLCFHNSDEINNKNTLRLLCYIENKKLYIKDNKCNNFASNNLSEKTLLKCEKILNNDEKHCVINYSTDKIELIIINKFLNDKVILNKITDKFYIGKRFEYFSFKPTFSKQNVEYIQKKNDAIKEYTDLINNISPQEQKKAIAEEHSAILFCIDTLLVEEIITLTDTLKSLLKLCDTKESSIITSCLKSNRSDFYDPKLKSNTFVKFNDNPVIIHYESSQPIIKTNIPTINHQN